MTNIDYSIGQFLGGYFHQDYDLEFSNMNDFIFNFTRDHTEKDLKELIEDIDFMLKRYPNEKVLEKYIKNILIDDFHPNNTGIEMENWTLFFTFIKTECDNFLKKNDLK